jgi:pimeloyl-ACP methyl ester carboxylesterase
VSDGAVVCLHGLGRTPSDWAAVRAGLEAFGPVRCPALTRARPHALASARAAVGAGAGAAPVVLVGHSMGAVIALRIAAEAPAAVRGVVLSGCFFPPARNGRTLPASVADYARHRVAFVRAARRAPRVAGPVARRGTGTALRPLLGYAARPARFAALAGAVRAPVLVVHARDDHHVPVDFALAAAAGRPGWTLRVLATGGHHAHVATPGAWLAAVTPWLAGLSGRVRACGAS